MSVIESIPSYQVEGGDGRRVAAPALYKRTPGIYGALFDEALTTAEYGIAALADSQTRYTPSVTYTPQSTVYGSKNSLATSLQLTAEMIVTQPSVKICHVVLGGFDTHQDEDTRQNALLAYVDSAVSAFMQDITNHGMADRVVLMTWSEFGRRVVENGGNGTDHGAAAPIFVVGKPVKGGVFGEQPSLTSTVELGKSQIQRRLSQRLSNAHPRLVAGRPDLRTRRLIPRAPNHSDCVIMPLSTRALKLASGIGAVAVCGVSGLLVATDPKPGTAPLRPPVSGASPNAAALLIPPTCNTSGALDPALLTVVQQLHQATTASARRTILASLSASQRLEVEAYLQSLRRSATGTTTPCDSTGTSDPIAPSVIEAPASTQPLINTYVS